jgi:hypothetical protein
MHRAQRDNGSIGTRRARLRPARRALPIIVLLLAGGCRPAGPTAVLPPGGGSEYVLDEAVFTDSVAPVFTARGCDTIECHGGGIRGTFALSPAGDKDPAFDFEQAGWQVDGDDPAASPLLRKPLAITAGGDAHAGEAEGGIFASTDDPDYQVILAWITAGERR